MLVAVIYEINAPLVFTRNVSVLASDQAVLQGMGNTVVQVNAGAVVHLQSVNISSCTFYSATGVVNFGELRMTECSVHGFFRDANNGANGAGIQNAQGATLIMDDCDAHDNRIGSTVGESRGGGLANLGHAEIFRSRFYHNTAYGEGGGAIANCGGSLFMSGTSVYNNTAGNSRGLGGGILFTRGSGRVVFTRSAVWYNTIVGHSTISSGTPSDFAFYRTDPSPSRCDL